MPQLKSFYAIVEPPSPGSAQDTPLGIWFPDLPGCVSLASDWNSVASRAEEALGLHLAGMVLDGEPIPTPSPRLEVMKVLCEHPSSFPERVTVDLESEVAQARERRGKAERINITVQSKELEIVDELSEKLGLTRSAYFRRSALILPVLLRAIQAILAESERDKADDSRHSWGALLRENASTPVTGMGLSCHVETLRHTFETFRPFLQEESSGSRKK